MTGEADRSSPDRLASVILDETGLAAVSPAIAQERRVAIFDLVEGNRFRLRGNETEGQASGPYHLRLSVRERRLVFDLSAETGPVAVQFFIPLSPFQQTVKDYFQICESYIEAVRHLPAAQIETLDEARREIYNEGSRALLERLDAHAETDIATARRLFTLLCTLYPKG